MSRGKVIGIGGVFFKSDHQADLNEWYTKHLGFERTEYNAVLFPWKSDRDHVTVWSIFPGKSKYYDGPFMINYIVDDLDAMLARLESEGVNIDPKRQEDPGMGKFAWIYDSDGNKIELWEPAKE